MPSQLYQWKWKLLGCGRPLVTSWTIQSLKFSRTEYWTEYPFPSPGDLPNPGIPHCRQILYRWATREAPDSSLWGRKELDKTELAHRNFSSTESARQKGELSHFATIPEPDKKEDSFRARTQSMKSHGLCLLWFPNFLSPLYKSATLLLPCGDLHVIHHGDRLWIAIPCWSGINPTLLEKYLVITRQHGYVENDHCTQK